MVRTSTLIAALFVAGDLGTVLLADGTTAPTDPDPSASPTRPDLLSWTAIDQQDNSPNFIYNLDIDWEALLGPTDREPFRYEAPGTASDSLPNDVHPDCLPPSPSPRFSPSPKRPQSTSDSLPNDVHPDFLPPSPSPRSSPSPKRPQTASDSLPNDASPDCLPPSPSPRSSSGRKRPRSKNSPPSLFAMVPASHHERGLELAQKTLQWDPQPADHRVVTGNAARIARLVMPPLYLDLIFSQAPKEVIGIFGPFQMKFMAQFYLDNFKTPPPARRNAVLYHLSRSVEAVLFCFWVHCAGRMDEFLSRHQSVPWSRFHRDYCTGAQICTFISTGRDRVKGVVSDPPSFDLVASSSDSRSGAIGFSSARSLRAYQVAREIVAAAAETDAGAEFCSPCDSAVMDQISFKFRGPSTLEEVQFLARFVLQHGVPNVFRSCACRVYMNKIVSIRSMLICYWDHCARDLDTFRARHRSFPINTFCRDYCSGKLICGTQKNQR